METDFGKLKKYERTTQEQLQFFIAFSRQYPDILKNYGVKGRKQDLWSSLADNLNNMRGPTRSAEKWKECLKNRINQIRCRARKSMLGWNRRTFHIRKSKKVDDHRGVEVVREEHMSDVSASTAQADEQPTTHMPTIPPDRLDHENTQSPIEDGNATNYDIPSIDLDTTTTDSNDLQSNHFDNMTVITRDHLEMLIGFVKQNAPSHRGFHDLWCSLAQALNGVEGKIAVHSVDAWKKSLLQWESQLTSTDSREEFQQEALNMLKILGLIENDKNSIFWDHMSSQTTNREPYFKEEPTVENETFAASTNGNYDTIDKETVSNSTYSHTKPSPLPPSQSSLPKDFIELVRESIRRREESEERTNFQHEQIANALILLNKNLEKMTNVIEKFSEKLDKL